MKRRTNFPAILSVLVLSVLFLNGRAYSSEVPKEPILRLETGMHTALIGRIGIDAQNQFLVTGSIDKTVRLWELSTGRLIKVLRPPIEKGIAGAIYCVAITPDGKTIACGGRTGFDGEKSESIYLFDRESGRLIRRIKDLPDSPVFHLAYSKDGRFLVATLGGAKGIRIYRTPDYSIGGEDKDYQGNSVRADFDAGGRLVTASHDGFIRLYGSDFKSILKKKAPGGNKPVSVQVFPGWFEHCRLLSGFFEGGRSLRERPFPPILSRYERRYQGKLYFRLLVVGW